VARKLRQFARGQSANRSRANAEDELERVMVDFVAHRFDLLLATTIVEKRSGYSQRQHPSSSTKPIAMAWPGFAPAAGRVGRYKHRAYCYLLSIRTAHHTERRQAGCGPSRSREIGAGFALSMRDLEIRGAGNLLGMQQSGTSRPWATNSTANCSKLPCDA